MSKLALARSYKDCRCCWEIRILHHCHPVWQPLGPAQPCPRAYQEALEQEPALGCADDGRSSPKPDTETGLPHLSRTSQRKAVYGPEVLSSHTGHPCVHLARFMEISEMCQLFFIMSLGVARGTLYGFMWAVWQGRSSPLEKSRLRCLDKDCPLRTTAEKGALNVKTLGSNE